ncbi:endocuticle structural glycoprotein ABD-4 [Tribolium castaneum]|uniref:Pupal cuticle protein Edg-78E-like Protein n=1 Tax=Tribolium castaneum TaxID=7070 RepID=D6WNU9_TRICA|nr:PREDICTED: endocuticle structural glycoprotein ABD-4 [Tribolium castaneum]EFA03209.1 Pupal cuticle protein Edg-78E-like Protein [Tribolium castaneum]|eukprot:XP_974019.1 PREDICTED: endocuticle structural glycoprotein ABD-4 [Tribolium castaneum]
MRSFTILIFASLALVKSSPQGDYNRHAPIVRQDAEVNPDGTHSYLYETGNGIYEDQQGFPKGPDNQAVQGQFQYQSPEGQIIRLVYTADENGFRPQGDHLPTPPPIPPEIQKALDYLATLPPRADEI